MWKEPSFVLPLWLPPDVAGVVPAQPVSIRQRITSRQNKFRLHFKIKTSCIEMVVKELNSKITI